MHSIYRDFSLVTYGAIPLIPIPVFCFLFSSVLSFCFVFFSCLSAQCSPAARTWVLSRPRQSSRSMIVDARCATLYSVIRYGRGIGSFGYVRLSHSHFHAFISLHATPLPLPLRLGLARLSFAFLALLLPRFLHSFFILFFYLAVDNFMMSGRFELLCEGEWWRERGASTQDGTKLRALVRLVLRVI